MVRPGVARHAEVSAFLSARVEDVIDALSTLGFVTVSDDGIAPTALAMAAAHHGLTCDAVSVMRTLLDEAQSPTDVLAAFSEIDWLFNYSLF